MAPFFKMRILISHFKRSIVFFAVVFLWVLTLSLSCISYQIGHLHYIEIGNTIQNPQPEISVRHCSPIPNPETMLVENMVDDLLEKVHTQYPGNNVWDNVRIKIFSDGNDSLQPRACLQFQAQRAQ